MAEDAWKRLAFNFTNLQSLGIPSTSFGNFVDNKRIYNMSPRRFNFYMQVLDSITNPNPEILTKVLKVENMTRQQRENISKGVNTVRKFLATAEDGKMDDFTKKINSRLGDNLVTKGYTVEAVPQKSAAQPAPASPTAATPNGPRDLRRFNTIVGGDYTALKNQLNTLRDKAYSGEKPEPGKDTLAKLFNNIVEPEPPGKIPAKDNAILKFYDEPYYSPNNEAIHWSDRVVFIAITYVIRAVAIFMVEWALFSNYIITFQGAFAMYFGIYAIVFILMVYLTNSRRDDRIFKLAFFYMNTATSDGKGYLRNLLHGIIVAMLVPIPTVVREYREFTQPEILTFTEKTQILNGIEKFTFYAWLLTSVVALNV